MKVDFCIETVSIIDPPLIKGGIISNNSSVAANKPIPNGPNILCPDHAIASAPNFEKSTGM